MITNDALWKGIIEDLLEDFLAFFFPDVSFDLERGVEFLDKELNEIYPLMGEEHKSRRVDKLIRLWTTFSEEMWLLIHIEVQGYHDQNLPERMYQYFYRLVDSFKKPVTSLVIFTDPYPNYQPSEYHYEVFGTKLDFSYRTYKVMAQKERTLKKSENPFAIVILTALTALKGKGKDGYQLINQKTQLARSLLERDFEKEKIRKIMSFIRFYIRMPEEKWNFLFEKEVEKLTSKSNTMGIEEILLDQAKQVGIEEGREEGREEFLYEIVHSLRQKGKTVGQISQLLNMNQDLIEKICEEKRK